MGLYDFLVDSYYNLLSVFPEPLQLIITLFLLVGVVVGFINLIRSNWLFLILLVLVLPVVLPILVHFFTDLWGFIVFLFHQVA